MTIEEIKRLKMAVKRYPRAVVGFNASGHPVVTVKTSRGAVAGLKNFMPDKLLHGIQGAVSSPQEADAMAEAVGVLLELQKHGSVDFLPISK